MSGPLEVTRRLVLIVVPAVALVGCVAVKEDVTHSLRGPRYPGYAIEYVDATPSPGTPLPEGSLVELKVTVRYVLQLRDAGIVELLFRNERDLDVLPPGAAVSITRGRWQTATLTQTIRVPPRLLNMVVSVAVLPDGESTSYGMLRIRYPVVPRQ